MKYINSLTIVLFILLIFQSCSAQKNYNNKIDSLITVKVMPYDEQRGDEAFWNITKERIDIVPSLIERISDTTKTRANVYYTGGNFTIGDICIVAISEIIKDFYVARLIESDQKLIDEKGYDIYWEYVRRDFKNRVELQKRVRAWFMKNRGNLVWNRDGYYIIKK